MSSYGRIYTIAGRLNLLLLNGFSRRGIEIKDLQLHNKAPFLWMLTSRPLTSSSQECEEILEDRIEKKLRGLNILDSELNFKNVRKIVSNLVEQGASSNSLVALFCSQPSVGNMSVQHWQKLVMTFTDCGFNIGQILHIVSSWPPVLRCNPSEITKTFNALHEMHIPSSVLTQLIVKEPLLLSISAVVLKKRYTQLSDMFTNKDIARYIKKTPKILHFSGEEIYMKVQFLISIMGLEQPQILQSEALMHPIEHLKIRHEFLKYCGKYTKPNPKYRALSKNPSLKLIMDSEDKVFVEKIAKVSLEEYTLFKKMIEEKKIIIETHPSNDSDEDDLD